MIFDLCFVVFDLIGNILLVCVMCFDIGFCILYFKFELQNFGGFIKDCIGVVMIEVVECDGCLWFGGIIVEVIVGNIGFGLVLVGCVKGYWVVLVVLDKMFIEKVLYLCVMGVEVYIICLDVGKGYLEYYQDVVVCLVQDIFGVFFVDQFNNLVNLLVYECGIGLEFWVQIGYDFDVIVVGVGFFGILIGFIWFFQKVQLELEMVFVDFEGLIMVEYFCFGILGMLGFWVVEGIGEDFVLVIVDFFSVCYVYFISDEESFVMVCELLCVEGIFGGFFIGILLVVVLCFCCEQKELKWVVSFVCDIGICYLLKIYNDQWMIDQGLL